MRIPKRFTILAAALLALNVVLWLAPVATALRQSFADQILGPSLIRAEVVAQAGAGTGTKEYRIDRGVVTAATARRVTIREQDGTVQMVRIAAGTQLEGVARARLGSLARRGAQVLVVRAARGAALSLDVED
ncbi:MAG TPA: hypothetical protein VHD91_10305 [Gaiellaceae bacterium]|nr:hypothetical protein [Gaiellaceae bacterium]